MASKKLGSGDLDSFLAFDEPLINPDGYGGTETSWTSDVVQCWGKVRYLRGTEAVMAARLDGRQPVVVTIGAHPESERITSDWRMRDTRLGAVYNIRSVIPTDDRSQIELTAESGVAV